MPGLKAKFHLKTLKSFQKRRRQLPLRILKAIKHELFAKDIYGLQWGNPDVAINLKAVKERYVLPFVNSQHTALEIGSGGGRWTRYLLDFAKLYVVDYHAEVLKELKKNFNRPNMVFIKNNGADFPGVERRSIDYLFTFGTFVHLDVDLIEAFLKNMKAIVKPGANIIIQYKSKGVIDVSSVLFSEDFSLLKGSYANKAGPWPDQWPSLNLPLARY